MKYLLDTHAFLWFISDDRRLSSTADSMIRNRTNEIYFSSASAWEIAIKSKLGRLTVEGDLASFLHGQLAVNGFLSLPITIPHAVLIRHLPDLHRDPFDRILVAQSRIEDMPLVSHDRMIRKYDIHVVW